MPMCKEFNFCPELCSLEKKKSPAALRKPLYSTNKNMHYYYYEYRWRQKAIPVSTEPIFKIGTVLEAGSLQK